MKTGYDIAHRCGEPVESNCEMSRILLKSRVAMNQIDYGANNVTMSVCVTNRDKRISSPCDIW